MKFRSSRLLETRNEEYRKALGKAMLLSFKSQFLHGFVRAEIGFFAFH